MKPTLQARLSQQLTLTPQLQQSIRLLQLSTLELHQEVDQMLEANPLLERDDEAAPGWDAAQQAESAERERERSRADETDSPAGAAQGGETAEGGAAERELAEQDFGTPEREDWANGTEGDDFDGIRELPSLRNAAGTGDEDDGPDGSGRDAAPQTLAQHLQAQLAGLRLAPEDRAAVELLIGSLDADGYLPDGPEALAEAWLPAGDGSEAVADAAREALVERLALARRLLQSLEPAGIGAQNLSECLVLQLQRLTPNPEREVAIAIAHSHLELLAKRDLKRLLMVAQALGADEDELRWAIDLIRGCDPRPGRAFGGEAAAPVIPDVIVRRAGPGGREFRVELNPDVMPRLRINELYAGALRSARGSTLAGSLQEARWFIKNIQQRFDTILRVSRAIVERQRRYFEHGEVGMRPLVLREIADELGLHESTISRVTTAKYMATPHGTVELKYFFGSGLATDAGGEASSTAVRALIRQLVAAENPKKPLSDGTLAELLAEQGIQVARRTVAKYREALKIAPAPQRKAV